VFFSNIHSDEIILFKIKLSIKEQMARNTQYLGEYRAVPLSLAESKLNLKELEYGNKIFLPQSVLEELSEREVTYPVMFHIENEETGKSTHCSVLEFTSTDGAYLPEQMMSQLEVTTGDSVRLSVEKLPMGEFVKLQPQELSFLEITDPKSVLEKAFRNYACLTEGDMISIMYNRNVYNFKILETTPGSAISIIETDLKVDFAPPPGYIEPSRLPPVIPYTPFPSSSNQTRPQTVGASTGSPFGASGRIPTVFGGAPQSTETRTSRLTFAAPVTPASQAARPTNPTGFVPFGGSGRRLT
jgi:ubiquitin fusion degradation protein 1